MRILLSISESPFDPTNGAARSMRTIAELMAAAGHQVVCLATTAQEHPTSPTFDWNEYRGVVYHLMNAKKDRTIMLRADFQESFDQRFDAHLRWKPDILLCYGGHERDIARFERARRAGIKVVFGLRNFGYVQNSQFLQQMDGIITSSQFLTDYYRQRLGIESTPLPLPIWPEDVIAVKREAIYFTAINPTREKGLMILATVFQTLHEKRPDIPLLLVGIPEHSWFGQTGTGRGECQMLWTANPRDIFAQTKVLLVPSVWEEPAGRVIAEAMLNGIPPIITDRGGMVEVANGGAIVLPLDSRVTVGQKTPVSMEVARPWIETIIRLHDDPASSHFQSRGNPYRKAWIAGQMYRPENVTPLYENYLGRILTGTPIPKAKSQLVNA